MLRLP